MKKVIFFLWFLIGSIPIILNAQECGFDSNSAQPFNRNPDPNNECIDPTTPLPNYNGPITFNLRLFIVRNDDGVTGGLNPTEIMDIKNDIDFAYNSKGISFIYTEEVIPSTEILLNGGVNLGFYNYPNCVGGVLYPVTTNTNVSGSAILGSPGRGMFWAKPKSVTHELGHALGLYHTFESHAGQDVRTEELVTRDPASPAPCDCNCLTTGDMVCDTPADPTVPDDEATDYCYAIGSTCTFDNCTGALSCSEPYIDPIGNLKDNIMAYGNRNCRSLITTGQARLIRETLVENMFGLANRLHDPSEPPFSTELSITTPTTWTGYKSFDKDVVVSSYLTIENGTIEFTPGAGILLEPGAKVTIRNSVLDKYNGTQCHKHFPPQWKGIEALPGVLNYWNPTTLDVLNGSIIQNAEIAIKSSGDNIFHLNVEDSYMLNNAVTLDKTNRHGGNFFIDSEIKVDENYLYLTYNSPHQIKINSAGLKLDGTQVILDKQNTVQNPDAIVAEDTGINILGTNRNSSFIGWRTAITQEATHVRHCFVSDTDFERNDFGLQIINPLGSIKIHDCTFLLGSATFNPGATSAVGITEGVDFYIHSNTFDGSMAQGNPLPSAIFVQHHLSEVNKSNIIRNNDFTGLSQAIRSSRDFADDMSGLVFLCNEMTDTEKYDLNCNGDIAPVQGIYENVSENFGSAKNSFHYNSFTYGDINYAPTIVFPPNEPMNIVYIYSSQGTEEPEDYTDLTVEKILENQLTVDCAIPDEPQDPNLPDKEPSPTLISLNNIKTNHQNQLNTLLDGGDTDGVVNVIDTYSDSDPAYVLNYLENLEPNLSIQATTALFAQSQNYTEEQVTRVLEGNPMVIQDDYLHYVIFNSGSFTATNQDKVRNAFIAHTSVRKDLVNAIRGDIQSIATEIRYLQNYYKAGEIDLDFERTLYTYNTGWITTVQTIESFLTELNYTESQRTLDTLLNYKGYSTSRDVEIDKYIILKNIQISLLQNNQSWADLVDPDLTTVRNLATGAYGLASVNARSILKLYKDEDHAVGDFDDQYSAISFTGKQLMTASIQPTVQYSSSDKQIFVRDLELKKAEMDIQVYSIDGKLMFSKTLNGLEIPADLPLGIYVYRIFNKTTGETYSGKIISGIE